MKLKLNRISKLLIFVGAVQSEDYKYHLEEIRPKNVKIMGDSIK